MAGQRRLTIRVSDNLHRRLKALAKQRGVTLSALVREALQRAVVTALKGDHAPDQRNAGKAANRRRDPVIEALNRGVDWEALRENLRLTPEERIRKLGREIAARAASTDRPRDG